ncbi:MAG TPA: NAD(P)H-dependent oxidoreductase [Candidatus Sumerlaeota bacterium]|nr:MAG: FMN-dependent NADPH-azoreductase [candidate division BRC1 bacterium ADurb.BinA292]HOE95498.1 NAD(P)H-dependent oxidoreductase [Candidatus Sumerlaeota bacterium]
MTKILGVVGSLRSRSHTRKLVALALEEAAAIGAETRLLNLEETPLPMFNPERRGADPVEQQVRELVVWADAFILGTPDYHGSMSGAMKNFLDFFWKEFTGKLFAYIVASHEKGLTVQDQLRTAVRQCYGWSLPYGIGFNGDAVFDGNDELIDEVVAERVRMLAHDLTVYGGLIHGQFLREIQNEPRAPGFARNFRP